MSRLFNLPQPVHVLLGPSYWRFKLYRKGLRLCLMFSIFGRFSSDGTVVQVAGRLGPVIR